MKKCVLLLLLIFMITSCSITTETNVTCWKHKICAGDTYHYTRTPREGGGYYATDVQIVQFRNNRVLIRHDGNKEHWVKTNDLDRYSTPVNVRQVPNRGHGQGKGRGNR